MDRERLIALFKAPPADSSDTIAARVPESLLKEYSNLAVECGCRRNQLLWFALEFAIVNREFYESLDE